MIRTGGCTMKKKFTFIATFMLAVSCVFAFAGCALFNVLPSEDKFPYEIATENGYSGSAGSWLASQENATSQTRLMYDEAVADGSFSGTYYEFLQSLNLNVAGDDSVGVNTALRSAVSIVSTFQTTSGKVSKSGSGSVYSLDKASGDAYIVTNLHVVYNANSTGREAVTHVSEDISVFLYGNETQTGKIRAEFVGGAINHDVAVLKITGSDILKNSSVTEITWENSDAITVGESVYAIGNGDGQGISVSKGVVSVDAEYITLKACDDRTNISLLEIRYDAAVNHGNSGGGLFNKEGRFLGVVNARSEKDGVEGFGYAIPANLALPIVQNIIDNRATGSYGALRATMGITVQSTNSHSVYDEDTGKMYIEEQIVVSVVNRQTIAESAGLNVGDTVVRAEIKRGGTVVRAVNVTRRFQLTNLLFEVRKGDTLSVTVSRTGEDELVVCDLEFVENNQFTLFGTTPVNA